MATPDPSNWRASHPSPSAGRKATLRAPAACRAVARPTTARSAPSGPSDSMRCATRSPAIPTRRIIPPSDLRGAGPFGSKTARARQRVGRLGYAGVGNVERADAPSIDEHAEPQLQVDQRPEDFSVILASVQMRSDQPVDVPLIEIPTLPERGLLKNRQVAAHSARIAQPRADRDAEAGLAPVNDVARQVSGGQPFEQVLALKVLELQPVRDRG